MKFVKKILSLIFVLLLISLVSLVGYAFVANFNEYKPLLTEKVEQATGREFRINGDIKIALWPWLGLQLMDAELSNAAGFTHRPFAQINELDLKLEWTSLLQKKINIDKALLHGLTLSLQKDAKGKNNWDDLLSHQSTQEVAPEADNNNESMMAMARISIQSVEVKKGTLLWHDESAKTRVSINDVDLETGVLAFDKNVPLIFSGQIKTQEPEANITFKMESAAQVNKKEGSLSLNQAAIKIRMLTPKLLAQNTEIKLTGSFTAQPNEQQYTVNNLEMEANTKGYRLPGRELNIKLNTSVAINLIQQTAIIKSIEINSTGMQLNSSAKINKLDTNPVITGQLSLAKFNPVGVANKYKIKLPIMSDKLALQNMQAKFEYKISQQQFELNKLSLQLDDSAISGQLTVKNFSAPRFKYKIQLDDINLDRYLPPKKTRSTRRLLQAVGLSDVPISLPVEKLRQLNSDGVVKANKIIWNGVKLEKIYIKTRSKKGVVVVNPVNARLFNGRLAMAGRMDVRSSKVKYSLNIKAKSLQLEQAAEPVLRKILNEKNASLKGKINLSAKLNTQGDSTHKLVSALQGQFDFRTGKVQLQGADIEYYLRQRAWYALDRKMRRSGRGVLSLLKKKKFPVNEKEFMSEYQAKDKTAFNVIRGKGSIKKGVVNNSEFLMASTRLNVNGKGAIYLLNQRMNYAAEIDLHRSNDSLKDQLLDIPLTVNLNGSFATLKPQANIDDWLNKAWSRVESKGKKRVKRTIKKKPEEQYKNMLKQWQY